MNRDEPYRSEINPANERPLIQQPTRLQPENSRLGSDPTKRINDPRILKQRHEHRAQRMHEMAITDPVDVGRVYRLGGPARPPPSPVADVGAAPAPQAQQPSPEAGLDPVGNRDECEGAGAIPSS